MTVINIFDLGNDNLQIFTDYRGVIADVFYNTEISHVTIIKSEPNVLRGNHYHAETTQAMLITKGELEYWYKPLGNEEIKMYLAKVGDLITTPPNEIHTLWITDKGNEFVVFTKGKRGGKDYESDTIRVKPIR